MEKQSKQAINQSMIYLMGKDMNEQFDQRVYVVAIWLLEVQ